MHGGSLRGTLTLLLLLVGLTFPAAAPEAAETDETGDANVALRWALGAWDAENPSPSAVKKDTQLATGARLKFLVEPLSPAFVYLLLLDSDGGLHELYRHSPASDGEKTYVPPGSQKFALDDKPGQETFFLLGSVEPLAALDVLLAEHAAAAEASKGELTERIVQEIRRLHRANRHFARPVEKPVMIGGQTRGGPVGSAIDRFAVEISAESFYGKTITIDH